MVFDTGLFVFLLLVYDSSSSKEICSDAGSVLVGRVSGVYTLSALDAVSKGGSGYLQRSLSWCLSRFQVNHACGDAGVAVSVARGLVTPLYGLLACRLVRQTAISSAVLRLAA